MVGCRNITIALISACGIVGCNRPAGTAPTSQPTSAPAIIVTTRSAEPVVMTIEDQIYDFPPARLVLGSDGNHLTAVLVTNDPPGAADEGYIGNAVYLEMTPEITDQNSMAGAQWDFVETSGEDQNEVTGIYLHGRRWHLEPATVHVDFENSESPMTMDIKGSFRMFDDDDPDQPGRLVSVESHVIAEVKVESSANSSFSRPKDQAE